MKKIWIAFLTMSALFVSAADTLSFKVYLAPKCDRSLRAENMTEEKFWEKIPISSEFGSFPLKTVGGTLEKTFFQATYNENGLFFRVICSEKAAGKLDFSYVEKLRDNWSALEKAPIVEIFLDPLFSRKLCAQIGVNINHCIFDKLGSNVMWNYPLASKSLLHKDTQHYSIFCSFPWLYGNEQNPIGVDYLFVMSPNTTPVIGFNIAREQIIGGGELSQWNRTSKMFNQPSEFGALVLAEEPAASQKMLSLFTDTVLKNGVEFEGDISKASVILSAIFKQKIAAGQKLLTLLPEKEQSAVRQKLMDLNSRFETGNQGSEQKKLLSECIQMNDDLKKRAVVNLEKNLFNEF